MQVKTSSHRRHGWRLRVKRCMKRKLLPTKEMGAGGLKALARKRVQPHQEVCISQVGSDASTYKQHNFSIVFKGS